MPESLDFNGEAHASSNTSIRWTALHLRYHLETLDVFCTRRGIGPDQAAQLRTAYTSALFELSTLPPDTTISQTAENIHDRAFEQRDAILITGTESLE